MKWLVLFVFVLVVGLACAAGDWGDINDGNGSDVVVPAAVNNSGDGVPVVDNDYVAPDYSDSGGDAFEYTDNFYIALGLGGFGLLIVIYFVYLFFRKPKNKWKS